MNPNKLRQFVRAPAGDSDAGGGESTGTLAQAKQAVTSTARDTAQRIKSAATDTAERAKSEAQRMASTTKEETANRIGGYSSAMHESARSLEQQDPNIAWATHRIADRVQSAADYLRTRDFAGMKSDVEEFARRHPLAFFGGLFVGGLVIGNLLKARQPSDDTDDMTDSTGFGESNAQENWDTGNQSGSETMTDSPATGGL